MTNPRELVERLRAIDVDDDHDLFVNADILAEAASEITRLRDFITALEDGNMTFLCDQLDRAKEENTRLRGLLAAWERLAGRDRINLVGKNGDSLDEIVLTGMAHLEKMTSGYWYLGLYRPDGSGYQVWLSAAKGPMRADYAELDAREEPEKQNATSTPSGQ